MARFLHGTDLKVAKEQLKQVITEAAGEKEFPDSSSDFRAIEASYHRGRFYAFKASLRVPSTLSASFFLLRCCSCNYIHYDVTSSFPHLGHSGIVEAARELFMQIEGNPERLGSIWRGTERLAPTYLEVGETMQAANAKKPCTTTSKATKPKSSPLKDPQNVAAKNRRERISERLKTLQELVPNGSKVDFSN
ncbi:uncharacterized protein [Phaseolus vulgaris]|uniref:uncharacterized protein n=1 Tax=Phaseolus vulgaris TaxID=3885 RepID=UPI0035CA3D38